MSPCVPAADPGDFAERLARLGRLAARLGVTTLVLRNPATLGWLLGARTHVPQTLDAACLDVVVTRGAQAEATVVTNAIEAPRLRDTELAGLPLAWDVVPWWKDRLLHLPCGPGVGWEGPPPRGSGAADVAGHLAQERQVLTSAQQRQLADLAAYATQAAGEVARRLRPDLTEYEAAALLAAALLERAADPVVLLVAGHQNRRTQRHSLPTTKPLGASAMLACCARRHGVVASVTRLVSFGELSTEESDAYDRLLAVEQAFLDASALGTRLGDVVTAGTDAYGHNGFDPAEWHRHHQGGLTGTLPREFPATPASRQVLGEGNAVAWNPSADGWKVEDTCLVTADGVVALDADPTWPVRPVGGRQRPGVLVL